MFILARPSSFIIITHTSRLCNKMSNLGRLTTVDMDSRLVSEQNTYADIEAAYRSLKVTYGVKEDVILYGDVLITAANSVQVLPKILIGGSFSQTTTRNVGLREELLLHSTSQLGSNWEFNSHEYNAIMANGAAVFSSNSSVFTNAHFCLNCRIIKLTNSHTS
ncbi:hypothetical protein L1987_77304 [Smallanthus sonchifolius]|uniref:Uncharacterized protein n=1 Tax=Smallanthus sonchifolius TaxID=185202 RepID=A0ACB8Z9F9_9ASTR|nr:hypothetical protein L1987_77304 [Smallanthus sonchifolius]